MSDLYIIVDVITTTSLLSLAFVALLNGGIKIKLNRLYATFSVVLALWLLSNHLSNIWSFGHTTLLWINYAVFGFSLAALILFLKVVINISEIGRARSLFRKIEWALWICVLLGMSPLTVANITNNGDVVGVVFGPFVWVYGLALVLIALLTLGLLGYGMRSLEGVVRKRMRTIGITLAVVMPIMLILLFILPVLTGNFNLTGLGVTPTVFLAFSIYYAVARYQLFDIKQATMRTVGYVLTIVTMAGIYVALAYAISLLFFRGQVVEGISFSPLNIALALVLAFVFQPIKRFFDRITNKIFYRDEYDRDAFFMEFGRILSHDTDLKLLLREASHYLSSNLKAEYALFYLFDRGAYGNGQAKRFNINQADIDLLTGYTQSKMVNPEAMASEAVDDSTVKELLEKHKIKIFMPLMAKKEIFGYLFFGDHKSRGYSRRDLVVLGSIANELNIAIQNSMSVEEIREINATLQQSIDEATDELRTKNRQLQRLDEIKDEFLSIASHQLRTPLTSVKGYIDMLLEGDFGPVSAKQREVLGDVFTSSERMVQLINDFLNVSRIQTGRFTLERRPTDLEELIEKEIKLISTQLEQRDLKIDWKCDEVMPLLNIDTDKVRQVVVNMVDNAVYYSRPDTTIKIKLVKEKDNLVFTVTDTGIGVPAKEQVNLFGKFFRASNARKRRPDGTGVGLYLAKKIIDTHGGEVIFKSTEGRGSTFGFKLPILS